MLNIKKITKTTPKGVHNKPSVRSERGDTIVEVLVAIAILGSVLGSAYVVSNRSVKSNQSSQEHLEAVKLIEGQFEKIKILSSSTPGVYDWDGFCVDYANTKLDSAASCGLNSSGKQAAAGENSYQVWTRRVAYLTLNGNPQGGTRYKVTVTWSSITSGADDKVEQYYEVYK